MSITTEGRSSRDEVVRQLHALADRVRSEDEEMGLLLAIMEKDGPNSVATDVLLHAISPRGLMMLFMDIFAIAQLRCNEIINKDDSPDDVRKDAINATVDIAVLRHLVQQWSDDERTRH